MGYQMSRAVGMLIKIPTDSDARNGESDGLHRTAGRLVCLLPYRVDDRVSWVVKPTAPIGHQVGSDVGERRTPVGRISRSDRIPVPRRSKRALRGFDGRGTFSNAENQQGCASQVTRTFTPIEHGIRYSTSVISCDSRFLPERRPLRMASSCGDL